MARRRVPGGQITTVIGFEQPAVLNDRSHTRFVVGMRGGPFITEQTGNQHELQVDLTPLRARALFGVPMHQLTNQERVYMAVEDPDSHCERAKAAGAQIVWGPADTDYGIRMYSARDLEGHI